MGVTIKAAALTCRPFVYSFKMTLVANSLPLKLVNSFPVDYTTKCNYSTLQYSVVHSSSSKISFSGSLNESGFYITKAPIATAAKRYNAQTQNTKDKETSLRSDVGNKGTKRKKFTGKVRMDFYYDTISPYSWIAFEILQRYKPIWNLVINYKPVFMGGLVKASGNKFLGNLASMPNKSLYVFQDIVRAGAYYQIPLRVPESPFYLLGVAGSLKQQRLLTAVKLNCPEYIEACSRQLWFRCWSEDMDATTDESFLIIGLRAGMKQEEVFNCIQAANSDAVKEELKNTTSKAVTDGAFGLPFMTIARRNMAKKSGQADIGDIERFFGSDRFEVMANNLGNK